MNAPLLSLASCFIIVIRECRDSFPRVGGKTHICSVLSMCIIKMADCADPFPPIHALS